MPSFPIEVIVRCKNEMPYVRDTVRRLSDAGLRIVAFDSGSTDGSREILASAADDLVDIEPAAYIPGRVLNQAMKRTRGDVVAFVNADAIPVDEAGVSMLVAACRAGAAASFGRQLPRESASAAIRADHERAFPDFGNKLPTPWFFSMAASAIRRDVWEAMPFDEELRYSEDIDWTFRARALGLSIMYIPEARFVHSHEYDAKALAKRMQGEAEAARRIFRIAAPSITRGLAVPLVGQLARDVKDGVMDTKTAQLRAVAQVARLRGGRKEPAPRPSVAGGHAPRAEGWTSRREPADEAFVQDLVERATAAVAKDLGTSMRALMLVGSFGAGEGAVERSEGVARIHNDLDMVAVMNDEPRRHRAHCEQLGRRVSRNLGATVDIWPISADELHARDGRLIWVDAAVRGTRLLHGDATALAPLANLGPRDVSLEEIGRLIANRATGLALSRMALAIDPHNPVEQRRAARHLSKARLAVGDALLFLTDRFVPGDRARAEALAALGRVGAPWTSVVAVGYAAAIDFRRAGGVETITSRQYSDACRALWPAFAAIERMRDAPATAEPIDLANDLRARFTELRDVHPIAKHLGGARAAVRGVVSWRRALATPRDTLARSSMILAFDTDLSRASAIAGEWLGTSRPEPAILSAALERLRDAAA